MRSQTPSVLVALPVSGDLSGAHGIVQDLAEAQIFHSSPPRILIVDNNPIPRRKELRGMLSEGSSIPLTYVHEPKIGIPFARNAAVQHALDCGVDAIVFIDDDERPGREWLDALLQTWGRSGADIVLGPAHAVLPEDAPRWARTSGVFDKDRRLSDGTPIRTAYSYNVLLSRRALETLGPTFDPAFRYIGSSDHDYFKRAASAGLRSVWSPDALVHENIGPERLRVRWVLMRGYRIGVGARVSALRRLPLHQALLKIAWLAVANTGYGGLNLVGTLHPHFSWVQGLRRLSIAAGLLTGDVLSYEEYAPDERGQ